MERSNVLHEYMLPRVASVKLSARGMKKDYFGFPSRYFFCCESDGESVDIFYNDCVQRVFNGARSVASVFRQEHRLRNTLFLSSILPKVRGSFVADMADARNCNSEVYFGKDVNLFQFNRRRGDRNAVLWRLHSYFEPTSRLGHVDGSLINDSIRFQDKAPVVFWRGGVSGCHWTTPLRTIYAQKLRSFDEMTEYLPYFSRLKAVIEMGRKYDFLDCLFSGEDVSENRDLCGLGFFGEAVTPADMLGNKYILCLNGNCVSTQSYWQCH